jgi:hypothetical protein
MEPSNKSQFVLATELSSRFRSKEDLYRYLVSHGKFIMYCVKYVIVGVFLPPMQRTSLDFLRDILKEEKLFLK